MTTFASHITKGTHAARLAATAVPSGSLYSCSDHSLIYQSDGATWSTYATLGGVATTPTASASRTAGDVTISYSASLTAVDASLDVTIAAATGDVVELTLSGLMSGHSTGASPMNCNFTAKTRVSSADVNNVAPGGATFVPAWFGPDISSPGTDPFKINGSHLYTVQSGDISGGNVTFRLYYQSANAGSATRTLYAASGTLPLNIYVKNLKH